MTDKGLDQFLPTAVQKSYFLLSSTERDVLNRALEQYRPGHAEPIYVGGKNLLKPTLRLMTDFRLMIEDIEDGEFVSTYTRWVDAVRVKGADYEEVYLVFSSRFERIWPEAKRFMSVRRNYQTRMSARYRPGAPI